LWIVSHRGSLESIAGYVNTQLVYHVSWITSQAASSHGPISTELFFEGERPKQIESPDAAALC
jgi:hypothetical protein